MSTEGFKQPFWWTPDWVVMSHDGEVWAAPDPWSAIEFCYALISEYQVATYGGADPHAHITATAREWGFPIAGAQP